MTGSVAQHCTGKDNEQVKRNELTALIQQLPQQHHDTLVELLIHLERFVIRNVL